MGPAPRPMRGASPEPNHGQQFPEKIRPMSEPSVEFVRLQDGRDGDAEFKFRVFREHNPYFYPPEKRRSLLCPTSCGCRLSQLD
jgi:hypothetical protein